MPGAASFMVAEFVHLVSISTHPQERIELLVAQMVAFFGLKFLAC
jgi:hypothetical protein